MQVDVYSVQNVHGVNVIKGEKYMKYDWNIHAVLQNEDATLKFPYLVDYHTHGLEKHGLKNLCMFFDYGDNGLTNAELINTIAEMMINGEKFNLNRCHAIDGGIGTPILFKFYLEKKIWHGEEMLQIVVLDENGDIPELGDNELSNRYRYQLLNTSTLRYIFGDK